jgi:hypothetical protein
MQTDSKPAVDRMKMAATQNVSDCCALWAWLRKKIMVNVVSLSVGGNGLRKVWNVRNDIYCVTIILCRVTIL